MTKDKPKKYRILAQWNQFRTQVIPPNSPDIQVKEMRRAFYAGVECALNRLAQEMTPGDAYDDPSDEQVIRDVHAELAEFANDVKESRA